MTIEEERKHHEITPANGDKSILRRAKELTVVVKEANFPLVPEISWILCHSALTEGHIHLCEETFVPFAVNVPVLHCMGDVRSLDDVWGGRKATGRMISTEDTVKAKAGSVKGLTFNYNGGTEVIVLFMGNAVI